jgi:hypothetical protein
MKKVLLLCAAMALVASAAFANGVDLTVGACPGGLGVASDAGTVDCLNGQVVTFLGTFQPATAIPDLNGIDITFDFTVAGDLTSDANFWDFSAGNAAALGSAFTRAANCTAYTNTWPSGSISGALGVFRTPNIQRIVAAAARSTGLATIANQKLFGIQLTVDASTSAEAGGVAVGCTKAMAIVLNNIQPRTISGVDPQAEQSPAGFGQCVTANSASGTMCAAVPTRKHTWGRLKSLYR